MASDKVGAFAGMHATLGLGPFDQIAFAVGDLEAVLPAYQAMFGAFAVHEATFSPDEVVYRGTPASASLLVAIGRWWGIEIELIQVVEGAAPTLDHVRRHGDGLHHLRFPVPDLDERKDALERAGWGTVLYGRRPTGLTFAYLEAPTKFGHTLLELIEFAPGDPRRTMAPAPSFAATERNR